jgi:hypothetical protein
MPEAEAVSDLAIDMEGATLSENASTKPDIAG